MSFRIHSAQEEKKKRFLKLRSLLAVIVRLLELIQPFLTRDTGKQEAGESLGEGCRKSCILQEALFSVPRGDAEGAA